MKFFRLTPLIFLLTLSGCISIPNIDQNSKIKIQESKIGNNDFSISSELTHVASKDWWKQFNDIQLNRLMDQVFNNNIDQKIAQLNIDKVEQLTHVTRSNKGLQVNANTSFQRQKLSSEGFYPPPLGGSTINFAQIGLQASYNLDLFHKIDNEVAYQNLKKQSLIFQKEALQLNLSIQTFKLYGYWQYLYQQKEIYNTQKEVSQKLSKLIEKKIKYGLGTKDELLIINNLQNDIDVQLTQIQINMETTINALSQLTGVIDKNIIILEPSSLLDNLPQPIQAVSSNIIMQRPDIRAYMIDIEAQEKELQSLKADFYPSVSLDGEAGLQKIGLSHLFRASNLFSTVMPTINLPIFDSGRIKANYKVAGVDLNIFIEQYNQSVVQSYYDINDNIAKNKKTFEIYNIQTSALFNDKEKFSLESKKYTLGKTPYYSLVQAQLNYLTAQNMQLNTKFNFFNSHVDLIKVLGGVASL